MADINKPASDSPKDVIDTVISTVTKPGATFELTTGQLKVLIDNRAELQKKMKDLTKEELKELKERLYEEREEAIHEDKDIAATAKEIADLAEIERHIDIAISSTMSPETVADIGEIPENEKTFMDKVKDKLKDFSSIGALVKGWIAIKKMLMPLSENKAEEEKGIKGMEKLYGMFFGEVEIRTVFNDSFKEKGIKLTVVKGKKDNVAYATLQYEYRKFLAREIALNAGVDRTGIEEANPMDVFLKKLAEEYRVPSDEKHYETTLQGIAQKQQPKEKPMEGPRFA